MQVSIEEVEAGGHQMTIEVETAQAQQIGRTVARDAAIPGFRPGKAPIAAVLRSLSPEELAAAVGEASETQAIIEKALEESDLETSADTFLDSVAWSPMVLTVAVAAEKAAEKIAADATEIGEA